MRIALPPSLADQPGGRRRDAYEDRPGWPGRVRASLGLNVVATTADFRRVGNGIGPVLLRVVACTGSVPPLPQESSPGTVRTEELEGRVAHWCEVGGEKGILRTWYPTGQIASEIETRGGDWDERGRRWYANGKLKVEGFTRSQRAVGAWTWWYESNGLRRQGSYRDGVATGVWRSWSPDGTLRSVYTMAAGERHGHAELFNEDGSIKARGRFRNGLAHGEWTFWEEESRQPKRLLYVHGLETTPPASPRLPWVDAPSRSAIPSLRSITISLMTTRRTRRLAVNF